MPMPVRLAVAALAMLAASAGPCLALDLGPKNVPFSILGVATSIDVRASGDIRTQGDSVEIDATATGDLAAVQASALEIARKLPLPRDACRRRGANLVVNRIDQASIGAQGTAAVIEMSGQVSGWACAKVLGQKVKTKIADDSVTIRVPLELYQPAPDQIGVRLAGQATLSTGDPATAEAASALLGDLNAALTNALEKALDRPNAGRISVPVLPGLKLDIKQAAFAQDGPKLLVKASGHASMTSAALERLIDLAKP